MKVERTKTGSEPLDDFLKGGVENGIITNVFGESGSGKTNFCVQIAGKIASEGENVIYVDTERGFSPERFAQIASEEALDNVKLFEPVNFSQQENMIEEISQMLEEKDAGTVVVDSLVSLYRLEVNGDNVSDINNRLSDQLSQLSQIAREHDIPVIVTNQVYSNFDENGIELVGRDVPRYWSKCLLQLSKEEKGVRKIEIEKHRSMPEGKARKFQIKSKGLASPSEKGLF